MKILVSLITLLSLNSYADTWAVRDTYSGKLKNVSAVTYGDYNYISLVGTGACIENDIASAFAELSFLGTENTTVTKRSLAPDHFTIQVTGPVCVKHEPEMHGDCLEVAVKTRIEKVKLCDSNAKYFPIYETPEVEFQQIVKSEKTNYQALSGKKIQETNVYYSGTVQLRSRGSVALLTVKLNDYGYGISAGELIRAPKTFVVAVKASNQYPLNEPVKVTGGQCTVEKNVHRRYNITCEINGEKISGLTVPGWALGLSFPEKYTMPRGKMPSYSLKNVRTEQALVINEHYSSIGELWQILDQPNKSVCIARPSHAKFLADRLLGCNGGAHLRTAAENRERILTGYHITRSGLEFSTEMTVCTKEVNGDYDNVDCVQTKTENGSILIPFCK